MKKTCNESISDRQYFFFVLLIALAFVSSLIFLAFLTKKGEEILFLNGNHNARLDIFFFIITSLGNGLIIIPLAAFSILIKFRYAFIHLISFAGVGVICTIMKFWFNMPRPLALLDPNVIHFVEGVKVHTEHSLPSGHTATAFCAAITMSFVFKNRWTTFLFLSIALLVGLSRIYLAQHFLIDVAVGACIGSIITLISVTIVNTYTHPWLDNRAYPKLSFNENFH